MEYNGYTYDNNGKRKGITYYKCAKSNNVCCPGTAKKNVDGSIVEIKPHLPTHIRSMNENGNLMKIFKNILKNRAKNENVSLKSIYDEESRRHTVAAASYPWSSAESIMRFARRSSLPTLPQSLQDLATQFDDGSLNRFTCCDIILFQGCITDTDGKKSVIFACHQLINHVLANNITEIHADSTFKVVPVNMGKQLLSIHCMIENYSIPIVYALMETKSRNSYQCIVNFMKTNLFPGLRPRIIVTDYESALRDTLLTLGTEETRAIGCWFHHNQAVWKKMKSLHYLNLVNSNTLALKSLKMLMSLPLLPAANIEEGFILIKSFAIHHGVPMNNLFNYYQRYWIQRVGPNVLSVNGTPRRTNNNIESFHNALRYKFSVTHPSLWVFLSELCGLSKNYHNIVRQLDNGLQPTRNLKSKFLINSKRIKLAVEQHDAGIISTWQFLVKCSHSSTTYEERLRRWALDIEVQDILQDQEYEHEQEHEPEEQEQEQEQEHEQDIQVQTNSTCLTCMIVTAGNNVPQYIALPCGHAWICETCVSMLNEQYPKRCPICRADCDTYQRIFYG